MTNVVTGATQVDDEFGMVFVDNRNIVIETMKCAEDGADMILRLYDAYNCSSNVILHFGIPVKKVWLCDLMENNLEELEVAEDNSVSLKVKNFEIVTLRIEK